MLSKTYSVPDVSCEHCKRAIETAVGAMGGIGRVLVDIEHKTVDIDFDEAVASEATILSTLEEEGYPVAE